MLPIFRAWWMTGPRSRKVDAPKGPTSELYEVHEIPQQLTSFMAAKKEFQKTRNEFHAFLKLSCI